MLPVPFAIKFNSKTLEVGFHFDLLAFMIFHEYNVYIFSVDYHLQSIHEGKSGFHLWCWVTIYVYLFVHVTHSKFDYQIALSKKAVSETTMIHFILLYSSCHSINKKLIGRYSFAHLTICHLAVNFYVELQLSKFLISFNKRIPLENVKKYPGQRRVSLLFTASQKYDRAGQGPSLYLTEN